MQHASPKLAAVAAISALLTALPGVANTNGPAASLDMVIKGQCEIPTSYSGSPQTIVGNYLCLGGDEFTIVDVAASENPPVTGHGAFSKLLDSAREHSSLICVESQERAREYNAEPLRVTGQTGGRWTSGLAGHPSLTWNPNQRSNSTVS